MRDISGTIDPMTVAWSRNSGGESAGDDRVFRGRVGVFAGGFGPLMNPLPRVSWGKSILQFGVLGERGVSMWGVRARLLSESSDASLSGLSRGLLGYPSYLRVMRYDNGLTSLSGFPVVHI